MGRIIDEMVGKRFVRWTVIERVPKPMYTSSTAAFYLCRCKCGTERIVNGQSLRNGDSKSCGCYRNELCRERIKRISAEKKRIKEMIGE